MNATSVTQIIESLLEADNLPRVPKKIKVSPSMYQLLRSACDTIWIASIGDETWEGILIEIDRDLFGYTYELVY